MILDHAHCRYVIFCVSVSIKKQANLQLPLKVQNLEVFQLQGAKPHCPTNHGFCHLHIAVLVQLYCFITL